MTKSYIKIYGPPLPKALEVLRKIATEMPVVIKSYYDITGFEQKKRVKMISTSGFTLGEYDFFFEWKDEPTWKNLQKLTTKIDEEFSKLGCNYTTTTK